MNKIGIALIFWSTLCFSQSQFRLNKTEYFTASVVIDPGASIKEKGLNIGAEIEYVGFLYTRLSVTSFAALEDGYTDTTGSIGLSFTSGYFENVRYYVGGRLGFIYRKGTYPTSGFEAGIDFKLTDSTFVGLRSTYDYRSDWAFYSADPGMRYSGFIRAGVRW